MAAHSGTVIVGAGLAGAAAAAALRDLGDHEPITLIGEEPTLPYDRPPLSKAYLRGETDRNGTLLAPAWSWAERDIELRTGSTVVAIDAEANRVRLAGGGDLAYDRLLLATGATARRYDVPGGDLAGVLTLRSIDDADRIRAAAARAERILVIGDGWLGSETAASLRQLGHDVQLALPRTLPLVKAVGPAIAAVYADMHRERGVTLLPETRVAGFFGTGSVRWAETADGQRIDADLVIVAIGAAARTELARDAGLTVADGVVVDGQLRTSRPGIHAAGDCALVPHPDLGRALRTGHWGSGGAQGRHAAAAMLGSARVYSELPYAFSDQYDTGMEFWGDPALPGQLVVRGELGSRSFTAFWHEDGAVRAVLNMHVHGHAHAHDHGDPGGSGQAHDRQDGPDHGDEEREHEHGHGQHPDDQHEHDAGHSHAGGHLDPVDVGRLIRGGRVDPVMLGDPHVPIASLLSRG